MTEYKDVDYAAHVIDWQKKITDDFYDRAERRIAAIEAKSTGCMEPGMMSKFFGRKLRDPWD